jgi:hypothetical protein
MKRKLFALILMVCVCAGLYAQDSQDTLSQKKNKKGKDKVEKVFNPYGDDKVEIVRDRLNIDVYHSFWMGMPQEVKHMKFDPGFSVSALWDFKLPNNSPVSFGVGLGFSYFSQFTNALLKISDGWVMKYYVIDSGIKYKLNRINYMNCNLPIEFRYRHHKSGFKFSIGVRVGLIAEVSQNYKGSDPEGGSMDRHYKSREIYNTQNISVEAYTRIGWKAFAVFYGVHINKIFNNGKGPAEFPMSLGFSISLF